MTSNNLRYNLLSPEAIQDPYPVYERMRAEDPVYWYEPFQSWYLTRYDDVAAVLRDHRRFSSERVRELFALQLPDEVRAELGPLADGLELAFVFLDPPRHRVIRGHVAAAFTPRYVETLRPRVQQVVNELLDEVAGRGRMDGVADFACILPVRIIAELFGVPEADSRLFQRWAGAMNRLMGISANAPPGSLRELQSELVAMALYFIALILQRRREPSEDLLGRIVASQGGDAAFSDAELLATCIMLLFGGYEMVQNLLANSILLLLLHPRQCELLRARPALVPSALEEVLRYEPPAASFGRLATENVELRGRRIARGDHVIVSYGGANRDPAVFVAPQRFDIERADNQHVSFSTGIHHCIGAALARMQGQTALRALLERMPRLELATSRVQWHAEDLGIRSLRTLPVVF